MAKVIYENPLESEADLKELIREENGEGEGFDLWCPIAMPADLKIEWEFRPIAGRGCAVISFAVKDENAFHVAYYNRDSEKETQFHICTMIKDMGGQVVAVGADPLPEAASDLPWYRMTIIKKGRDVALWINELEIMSYHDDGMSHGELLTGGNVGLRQLGKLTAEYRNLKVTWI